MVISPMAPFLLVMGCVAESPPAGSPPADPPPDGPDPTVSEPEPEPPPAFTHCEGDSPAHAVFDSFWGTFDEIYAVFDIRLPDASWSDLGRDACAALGPEPSDEALYDVLIGLARNLDDGHVNLNAPELDRNEDAWVSEYPYYRETYRLELNAEERYLDAPLSWAARDWFAWGQAGDVGYVSITSFDGLSASGSEGADRDAAEAAMTLVMADLLDVRAMVIDVRANEGGWDSVGLDVAAWFAGEETVAWTEQRRDGPAHDDFTDPIEVKVAASKVGAFAGPVVLLTSGGTFSAAETFALAMRVRTDVTLVGERSSGHFSDLVVQPLPNGWVFSLSGERYTAADGEIYEKVGVPVEVPVDLDVDALELGQDVMLDAALATLAP